MSGSEFLLRLFNPNARRYLQAKEDCYNASGRDPLPQIDMVWSGLIQYKGKLLNMVRVLESPMGLRIVLMPPMLQR